MCLATAALAATAGSAIMGGVSSAQAANYQAQVARNNAQIAHQNEAYSASATSANVTQEGLKASQRDAQVRVGAAAQGLDVNSGSPAAVQASQRQLGDLDVATTASRGAEQVYGYGSQQTGFTAQAGLDQAQVGPDIAGGFLKAAGAAAGSPSFGGTPSTGGADASSIVSGSPGLPNNYSWMGNAGPGGGIPDEEFGGPF